MKLRKTHLLWIPLVVCLFLVNSVNVMAAIEQVIHVKGQVVDSTGEPVIGANIVVKGTNTGVISDIDGNFAIDAPKNSVLLISFIGYKSQEVKVTGTNKDDSGPKKPVQRKNKKVQPNDPCPCGKCYPDGRPIKYKNCCGRNQ